MSSFAYSGGSQPPKFVQGKLKPVNKPVIITGGSGKLGRACVKEFNDHGYFTIVLDVAPAPPGMPDANRPKAFTKADVTNMGDVLECLLEIDDRYNVKNTEVAIVHLAAIPAPGLAVDHVTMQTNLMSTFNIFDACRKLGIRNVVSASSETLIGLPLDPVLPNELPITEDSQPPRPESTYSLSKLLGETMAEEFCRWDSSFKICSMRFSNVMETSDYDNRFNTEEFQKNFEGRRWNAFGYIDARDGAQAVRRAIEKNFTGHHIFIIANADTVFNKPTEELVKEFFPSVKWNPKVMEHPNGQFKGNEGLLGIAKARAVLGFEPQYTWRK